MVRHCYTSIRESRVQGDGETPWPQDQVSPQWNFSLRKDTAAGTLGSSVSWISVGAHCGSAQKQRLQRSWWWGCWNSPVLFFPMGWNPSEGIPGSAKLLWARGRGGRGKLFSTLFYMVILRLCNIQGFCCCFIVVQKFPKVICSCSFIVFAIFVKDTGVGTS